MDVDCFLICDAAQAVGGKLYILGAGWDTIHSASFPTMHPHMALAMLIRVEWTEANEPIEFEIGLEDADNRPMEGVPPVKGGLTIGRPATSTPGQPLMAPLAIDLNNLLIPQEGTYQFALSLNGWVVKRTAFRALLAR